MARIGTGASYDELTCRGEDILVERGFLHKELVRVSREDL